MRTFTDSVEVKVGNNVFSREFENRKAETAQDILDLLQADWASVVKNWNYAEDLFRRRPIRDSIMKNEAETANAFKQQVKDLIKVRAAANRPVTEEQAQKLIEMLSTLELPS
jgi:hypothetical protein